MPSALPRLALAGLLAAASACPAVPVALEAERLNLDLEIPASQVILTAGLRETDDLSGFPDDQGNSLDTGEQASIGIEVVEVIENTFGYEVGFFYSHGDDEAFGRDYDLHVFDLYFGGRYTHTSLAPFLPYFGAGVDLVVADGTVFDSTTNQVVTSSSTDIAFYAHTGLQILIGRLLVGVDGRASFLGDDDLDSLQASFTLGWAF